MKNLLIALFIFASATGFSQSELLLYDDVLVDATYTTKVDGNITIPVTKLLFAGMIIHASAANATVTISDGATVLWRWKEPTDEKSSGWIFAEGGIPYSTNLIVDCTNCTATLVRRKK